MSAKLRTHIRSNIIGYVALFFALSTGSAVALTGSNTVFSDDIVDNEVYSADVRNDTLAGGGLAAADLQASSVGTSEVALNSLNGADINESLLGKVPNADKLDGIDSTGFLASGNVKKLIYEAPGGPSSPTAIATVGPYTIKGDCVVTSGMTFLKLIANVAGPAGEAAGTSDYMHHEHTSLGGGAYTHRSGQVGMIATADSEIIAPTLTAGSSEVVRTAGTAMLKTGSAVVQVDFNGVADGLGGSCYLFGTATMGT
ncbi:MAG: hypothetical protein AABM66_04625 [Actinomycetota bacterium]